MLGNLCCILGQQIYMVLVHIHLYVMDIKKMVISTSILVGVVATMAGISQMQY